MKVALFAKYGQKEHLFNLLNKGELYLQPFSNYRKIEDDGVRGDPNEGVAEHRTIPNGSKLSIKIDGEYQEVAEITSGAMRTFGSNFEKFSIYCLYAVTENWSLESLPDEIKKFGDHVAVIHNPKIFVERIKKVISELNGDCFRQLVEYKSGDEFEGFIGPFVKHNDFQWQSEFRICINTDLLTDNKINIGDLSDIISIYEAKDFDIQKEQKELA
ncbi:hypothetical protein ESZ36_16690 [Colwellia demingiae]|uniref:Uncharacterized protein n=1 Tax=Colwellia demingiae TaxID=89401 RepID=A0A5C6QBA4_9GAMM|nr:hypothetical protein [Colwellia demingiae]TWX65940.1 hypothetical protein ESZ36_16690 [Colwellia demingiae]